MKHKFILLLLCFTSFVLGQTGTNVKKIDCDSIKRGIFDKSLYININGKYFMHPKNKTNIFLIRIKHSNKTYLVSELVMNEIKNCNCKDVLIEKPIHKGDKNAPKIIRD